MKVTPGAMFGSMSGKVGGLVASHNRYGAYLRNHVIPVNRNTERQDQVRSIFSFLGTRFKTELTTTQVASWDDLG